MKPGDKVRITCSGHTVNGTVILASTNQKSLMLDFEAVLDGHVGMMPVLLADNGVYRTLMTDTPVEITPID